DRSCAAAFAHRRPAARRVSRSETMARGATGLRLEPEKIASDSAPHCVRTVPARKAVPSLGVKTLPCAPTCSCYVPKCRISADGSWEQALGIRKGRGAADNFAVFPLIFRCFFVPLEIRKQEESQLDER